MIVIWKDEKEFDHILVSYTRTRVNIAVVR